MWRHFASASCRGARVEKGVIPRAGAAEKGKQRHLPHLLTHDFTEPGSQPKLSSGATLRSTF